MSTLLRLPIVSAESGLSKTTIYARIGIHSSGQMIEVTAKLPPNLPPNYFESHPAARLAEPHWKAREAPPFRTGRDRAARVACHVVAFRILSPIM